MKALSILGIIFSSLGIIWNLFNIAISLDRSGAGDFIVGLIPLLFLNLFFLAFSIVGTVSSYNNKK